MSKIKAIFFDLDDTLVNSRNAEIKAACEFKKKFPEFDNMEDKEFEELWHKIAIEQYERYSKNEISYERHRIDRVKSLFSKFNIEKNDDEARQIFNIYLELYEKNWKLFDDSKEVLEKLKGNYKLGLITNGDSNQQRKKISLTEIGDYFSNIIISSEAEVSKPNKKIFEIACEKIEEEPQNCVMIGDSYKLDIQGAENYGLNAIWINRKNEKIEYGNQIKELQEILNLL